MKKEINLLVVCSKDEVTKIKEDCTKRSSVVKIKYEAYNYKEALKIINDTTNKIDAILIDSSLNNENVLDLLMNYKEDIMLSKTIVIDNIKLDCYNLSKSKYQIFNILPKNYKLEELLTCLEEINNKKDKYNYRKVNTYEKIADILKKLGIAPDKNGFHYLRKAIYECYLNPKLLTSITKEIYPMVSQTFSKKESCVERSIRSAIETGWDRGNYEYSNELFSNCVDYCKTKPTNGEFIAIIVDKLMLEEGKIAY